MTSIGTIKEIKDNENRVALTPAIAKKLVFDGHKVSVEKNAGVGAGFSDQDYHKAGATIMSDPREILKSSDIVVKIKEPLPREYEYLPLLRDKILFTYLHLAGVDRMLTLKLLEHNVTAIAYETVEDELGRLPLLAPMSEIAGVLAIQYGAQFLQKKYGGRGITMSSIVHATHPSVVVVGGGIVGTKASKVALGMGAHVTLFEKNERRRSDIIKEFSDFFPKSLLNNFIVKDSDDVSLGAACKRADLLIGAVLVKGAKAPKVVSTEMVQLMPHGSVIVDVAIDQGGCIAGSRPTSHTEPTFSEDGKVYCCIPNMPGQVSLQATEALTNATYPYVQLLLEKGLTDALCSDRGFFRGLITHQGKICYQAVAEGLGLQKYYEEPKWEQFCNLGPGKKKAKA